jgi:hypothetical protein
MRRALAACLTILAIALGAATTASASQLTLTGAQHPSSSVNVRCDDAVDVRPPSLATRQTSVTVSGIAAACSTLPLTFIVYSPSTGESRVTGTGVVPAGGGLVTFTTARYKPSSTDRAYVTIGSWPVPATWNGTLPALWCTVVNGAATDTCDATMSVFTGVKPGGTSSAKYYDIVVTTTSTTPVTWKVTFNLASSAYGTPVATRLGNSDLDPYSDGTTQWNGATAVNDVKAPGVCSAGLLTVSGVAAVSTTIDFSTVTAAKERRFSLVVDRTEVNYSDVLTGGCP